MECSIDTHRMTAHSLSMTEKEWEEYSNWEDKQKQTYGRDFNSFSRCFLRNPLEETHL